MQIDGGKNDRFAAYRPIPARWPWAITTDRKLPLWTIAKQYVLADNFFMGAFGGSFLNHFELVCACAPVYPDADKARQRLDFGRRSGRRPVDTGAGFAAIGAGRPPKFVNTMAQ